MFHNDTIDLSYLKQLIYQQNYERFLEDIMEHTSLCTYRSVKQEYSCAPYLLSTTSFRGKQLKFKLRTGVLGLGADLHRQNRGDGQCSACNEFESHKHFVIHCRLFTELRAKLYNDIRLIVGDFIFSMYLREPNVLFGELLGDHDGPMNSV